MFIYQSDSIPQDTLMAIQSPRAYPSLIQQNLHSGDMVIVERMSADHPFWVAGILIICLILLAWGRIFYVRRLDMIFRAVSAKNYANQLIREGNIFNERIGLVLFVIYLAMISLFVFLSIPLFARNIPDIPGHLLYLVIAAFFLVFWLIKVIVSRALSLLFNTGENSRELLSNMFLFNLVAGILILPLLACMAYAQADVFFYITLGIIILIYTFRFFREALVGFTVNNFSVFHLFLYLCTLEILPLIVLAKIFIRGMVL